MMRKYFLSFCFFVQSFELQFNGQSILQILTNLTQFKSSRLILGINSPSLDLSYILTLRPIKLWKRKITVDSNPDLNSPRNMNQAIVHYAVYTTHFTKQGLFSSNWLTFCFKISNTHKNVKMSFSQFTVYGSHHIQAVI